MEKIKIIDAMCGAGKTSWAIQYINANPDKSFVYCTPFLNEIHRIRESCGLFQRFDEPQQYNGGGKLDGFNMLLSEGRDIAVTHTTFLNATNQTMEFIQDSGYTLILDESLDVVTDFNTAQSVVNQEGQRIKSGDIDYMISNKSITIDELNKVHWIDGSFVDFKYSEVERFAKLGRLYCMDHKLLLTIFPPEIFQYFDDVYVMTYLFGGSTLKNYMEMFHLPYEVCSVHHDNNFGYTLSEWSVKSELENRARYKDLITIIENDDMNQEYNRKQALSSTWLDNADSEKFAHIKNHLGNFFRRITKASATNEEIMWTCKKGTDNKFYKALKGEGYTKRRYTNEERDQINNKNIPANKREKLKEEIDKKCSCFVPCNARATNIYGSRWALAYIMNFNINPEIQKFFAAANVTVDRDLYSLANLLQWIFRSRIRNQKPITIYIPSKRMRELLKDWINGDDSSVQAPLVHESQKTA